jgi:uncharacterized membrane protein YjjP (DUF1212 family)
VSSNSADISRGLPDLAAAAPPPRSDEVIRFLTQLGRALTVAGEAVSTTERTLDRIARAYGLQDYDISVLPTLLIVRGRESGQPAIAVAGAVGATLRLDQVAELYRLADLAEHARVEPGVGLQRIANIWSARARFGALPRIAGHLTLAVGLGLSLTPRPMALMYCAGLGLLVGVLKELGGYREGTRAVLPVAAALTVSTLIFLATREGLIVAPLLLLIPPLITFLPGGMLTIAMIELADMHILAGSSRLIAGTTQLVLLLFGLVAGADLVGLPAGVAFAERNDNTLGAWAPFVGPTIFALGVFLHFAGPRGSLLWLWLTVYVAWLGQQIGTAWLGGYAGSFVGALAMTVVAYTVQRVASAPPPLVLFLPAFWLLVPGVLGLIGFTQLVGTDLSSAVTDLTTMAFTIVSIAMGVLLGVGLYRTVLPGPAWLRSRQG